MRPQSASRARCAVTIAALVLLAGCAAQGTAPTVAPSGTALGAVDALPQRLSGFRRDGPATDYDREVLGRGLGASVRYVPTNGERIRATVYVYDRGRPRGPEGAGSPDVADELRLAVDEVAAAVEEGIYRGFEPGGGTTVGQLSDPGSVRCVTFRVVQRDGSPTADGACVAVQGGRFLKVRVTAWDFPKPAAAGALAAELLSQVERVQGGGARGGRP